MSSGLRARRWPVRFFFLATSSLVKKMRGWESFLVTIRRARYFSNCCSTLVTIVPGRNLEPCRDENFCWESRVPLRRGGAVCERPPESRGPFASDRSSSSDEEVGPFSETVPGDEDVEERSAHIARAHWSRSVSRSRSRTCLRCAFRRARSAGDNERSCSSASERSCTGGPSAASESSFSFRPRPCDGRRFLADVVSPSPAFFAAPSPITSRSLLSTPPPSSVLVPPTPTPVVDAAAAFATEGAPPRLTDTTPPSCFPPVR